MKKQCFLLFLLIFVPFFMIGCQNTQPPQSELIVNPTLFTTKINAKEISPTASSAVVGIGSIINNYRSVGTGVCVSPGIILSNEHVVSGNTTVTLYFQDGTNAKGTVVWTDPALDLSVIKTTQDIPHLEMVDLTNVNVGEEVIAIGTPIDLQFQQTVTKGIVSALNRTVAVDTDLGESYLQDLIQHDASINPGNSGGPLVKNKGQVIGINTLKVDSAEGLGFAIPTCAAQNVINHIVADGEYITPYLGVFGVDKLMGKFYGRDISRDGVLINNMDSSGPASKAGIKVGDIITEINQEPTNTMLDIRTLLYKYKVGEEINITYSRNGTSNSTTLTLTKKPS